MKSGIPAISLGGITGGIFFYPEGLKEESKGPLQSTLFSEFFKQNL